MWNDILAVEYVAEESLSLSVSKSMTRIQRHRGLHREVDGAMKWNTLLHMLCRYHSGALRWMNKMWNPDGFILYMRAKKATLEEPKLILRCWITCKIRTLGVSTSITLVLLLICFILSNQD